MQSLNVPILCKVFFEIVRISRCLVIKSERDSLWPIHLREPQLQYLTSLSFPPLLHLLNIHYAGNRDAFEEE